MEIVECIVIIFMIVLDCVDVVVGEGVFGV